MLSAGSWARRGSGGARSHRDGVVGRAGKAPQMAGAYLTMARVTLDRGDAEGVDDWLGRIAGVGAFGPEPHVQLAAAVLSALRRESAGKREAALAGLRAQGRSTVGAFHARCSNGPRSPRSRCSRARATSARPPACWSRCRQRGPLQAIASARLAPVARRCAAAIAIRSESATAQVTYARGSRGPCSTPCSPPRPATSSGRSTGSRTPWSPLCRGRCGVPSWPRRRTSARSWNERIERGTVAPDFAVDLLERMSAPPRRR